MDGKKISFGFKAKLKPGNLINAPIVKKPDHELIECLDQNSIKIIGKVEEKPKLLVIPLKSDNNATKRIANTALQIIKEEKGIETPGNDTIQPVEITKPVEPCSETLEQKAAREIIASITKTEVADETKIFSLPIKADELPLDGASESTIDDYENIPIRDFGLAMLRGMGWKDEDKKANDLKLPELRPKGMGLGADKLAKPKELLVQPAHNEVLEIKKNSYVKIIAGKHKNLYGQIEGLDDDSGRVNVVLSIGGSKISLNEFTLQVVTKEEWIKFGKIINSAQYEDYKNKDGMVEIKKEKSLKSEPPSSSNNKLSDHDLERNTNSQNNRTSKGSSSGYNDNSSSRRNCSDNDENDTKISSKYDKHKQTSSRSTSSSKYYQHKSRKASSGSSEDSDCADERRGHERHKKSSKSKKSSHDRHNRSRSKSRERHSRYSSDESSDDQKYHHKKKTKKSKKPRSRSRTRR